MKVRVHTGGNKEIVYDGTENIDYDDPTHPSKIGIKKYYEQKEIEKARSERINKSIANWTLKLLLVAFLLWIIFKIF